MVSYPCITCTLASVILSRALFLPLLCVSALAFISLISYALARWYFSSHTLLAVKTQGTMNEEVSGIMEECEERRAKHFIKIM